MNERFPLAYLLPLRVLFGLILIIEGWGKLRGGWLHGTQLMANLEGWMEAGKTYPFFLPVVHVAHAHPKIFGALLTLGELAVGISMLLGVLTRLGAFIGAVMLFGVAFGAGQKLAPPGNALLMAAVMVIFILAPPGRFLGIDARLRGRLPRWMA
jgi:thiosulfate dehydrogenase [quinone] large subunit